MLTQWARRHKGLKKWIAWHLYQKRDLQSAQVLHATSEAEAENFRAADLRQPIAVIPNGIEVNKIVARREGNRSPGVRTILFLGRIHPVKGLTNLVRAWAAVQKTENGKRKTEAWRIVIAGEGEGEHLQDVKGELKKMRVEKDFEFTGPVDGEGKWRLYQNVDLFVLPSYSENFGLVVAEALACGVPVITTCGTPWQDLIEHRCGWWIEIGVEPLANALREGIAMSDGQRHEMGRRGRQLIERKYAWPGIAAQMKSVYEWMLGRGPRSECVRVN
jgi:glycosyltransferase involved in cell wall biosynthesis